MAQREPRNGLHSTQLARATPDEASTMHAAAHFELSPSTDLLPARQYTWLAQTCDAIECFVLAVGVPEHLLPAAAFAIHSAAEQVSASTCVSDVEPSFALLEPAPLVRKLVRHAPYAFEDTLAALACFYEHLVRSHAIDARRGRFIASYFLTLLELHALHDAHPARAWQRASNPFALRLSRARAAAEAAQSANDHRAQQT